MNDFSDEEDGNTSEEGEYEDAAGGGGNHSSNAAMSLFASYYGIVDPEAEAAQANRPKGTIDDSDFDARGYVKRLLETEPVEGLIAKDTELVHEIRTLDGEMQKLVYDNYNKFITATETIKEMKQDVYGMDPDMEAVRTKMGQIAEDSQLLDSKLQPSRSKVDKLVRVRRLLERLEFLSELPERLAAMIDQKRYKEAVQLYNKTISVLTRHSHVLSFKNIKERTELMMMDLTGKVIDLLEEPSLEAVMLTQYVSVLRLMRAPTAKVARKLLSAHRAKSLRLIEEFSNALIAADANAIKSTSANSSPAKNSPIAAAAVAVSTPQSIKSNSSGGKAAGLLSPSGGENIRNPMLGVFSDISKARQFHQTLIVGLIEACKGIHELYHSSQTVHSPSSSSTAAASSSSSGSGYRCSIEEEYAHVYHALRGMIDEVMRVYSCCLCRAFAKFFSSFEASALQSAVDYADLSELKRDCARDLQALRQQFYPADGSSSGSTADDSQSTANNVDEVDAVAAAAAAAEDQNSSRVFAIEAAELQQEKNSWLLLARQAIVDVQFLDHNQQECFKKLPHRFTAAAPTPAHPDFAHIFAATATNNSSSGSKLIAKNLAAVAATATAAAWEAPKRSMITHTAAAGASDKSFKSHVPHFANTLLATLQAHADTLQSHRISCYLRSVYNTVPVYMSLLSAKNSCLNANKSGTSASQTNRQSEGSADDADGGSRGSGSQSAEQSTYQMARQNSANRNSFSVHGSGGGLGGSMHGFGGASAAVIEAQNDRSAVIKHASLCEQLLKLLQRNLITCFQDCAREIKPFVEMCEISKGNEDTVVLPMVARFHHLLAFGLELLTGLPNSVYQYDVATDSLLVLSADGELLPPKDGAMARDRTSSSQKRDSAASAAADIAEDWAEEIFVELPLPDLATALGNNSSNSSAQLFAKLQAEGAAASIDKSSESLQLQLQRPMLVFFNALLRQLIPTLMSQMQQQLQQLELPALEEHMSFQDQCYERLVVTAQMLLQTYLDSNIMHATSLATAAQSKAYLGNYETATAYSPSNDHELSAEALIAALNNDSSSAAAAAGGAAQQVGPTALAMIELVQLLDEMAVADCVLFGEAPPSAKASAGAGISAGGGRRPQGAASAIEKDIERLFSKRVKVLTAVTFNDAPSTLLCTVFKASLKAVNETVRTMTLPFPAYIQIQANVTFLRQVAAGLLKDSSECDPLVDQTLNAVFSRYLGANDITSASDSQEMALVSKAVSMAYSSVSSKTALINR